jgi:hypothetical protein
MGFHCCLRYQFFRQSHILGRSYQNLVYKILAPTHNHVKHKLMGADEFIPDSAGAPALRPKPPSEPRAGKSHETEDNKWIYHCKESG